MVSQLKLARKLRNKQDKIWRDKVRAIYSNKCAFCKCEGTLHTHHIIAREIKETRHDLVNGILLCPRHHKYSYQFSAHKNPLNFLEWFKYNYPDRYEYLKNKGANLLKNTTQNTQIKDSVEAKTTHSEENCLLYPL